MFFDTFRRNKFIKYHFMFNIIFEIVKLAFWGLDAVVNITLGNILYYLGYQFDMGDTEYHFQ